MTDTPPPVMGRPFIGEPVKVRLGELQAWVDTYAEAEDVSRAEAVRRLLRAGLAAVEGGWTESE